MSALDLSEIGYWFSIIGFGLACFNLGASWGRYSQRTLLEAEAELGDVQGIERNDDGDDS